MAHGRQTRPYEIIVIIIEGANTPISHPVRLVSLSEFTARISARNSNEKEKD